jgi:hypothetical protein
MNTTIINYILSISVLNCSIYYNRLSHITKHHLHYFKAALSIPSVYIEKNLFISIMLILGAISLASYNILSTYFNINLPSYIFEIAHPVLWPLCYIYLLLGIIFFLYILYALQCRINVLGSHLKIIKQIKINTLNQSKIDINTDININYNLLGVWYININRFFYYY